MAWLLAKPGIKKNDDILRGMSLIKKIWKWIKAIFKRKEPESAPSVLTELDKKLGQKIQQRQAKMGKPVDTSKGEHNMPKYQPCPKGHGLKKIEDKAIVGGVPGALYYCNQCKGRFFVRAKGV